MFRQLYEKIFYKKTGLIHDGYQNKKNYETIIAELFLKAYNKSKKEDYKIFQTQESPDFVCKNSKGKYISFDVTELFGTQKVIDQNTKTEMKAINEHREYELIEEELTTEDIQSRINHKDDPDKFINSKGEKILLISLLQYKHAENLFNLAKDHKFLRARNYDFAYLMYEKDVPLIIQLF